MKPTNTAIEGTEEETSYRVRRAPLPKQNHYRQPILVLAVTIVIFLVFGTLLTHTDAPTLSQIENPQLRVISVDLNDGHGSVGFKGKWKNNSRVINALIGRVESLPSPRFGRGINTEGINVSPRRVRVIRKRIPRSSNKPTGLDQGARSKADIMRTVRSNLASLKYAYRRRLKANPAIGEKITLKWAIDEFGNVLYCSIIESKLNDPVFEKVILQKIRSWAFGKINVPGDVTEVTYPFLFTK